MKSPTYEMRIVAEMFDNKWYPAGSDTPVPKEMCTAKRCSS